jgi:hypothetical protein
MRGPIFAAAALCALSGALPFAFAPALDRVARVFRAHHLGEMPALASLAPLGALSATGTALILLLVLIGLVVGAGAHRRSAAAPTWDCGYARPTARMQYTGRSFGEWIAERLLPRSLQVPAEESAPQGLFPRDARFASEAPARDPIARRIYEPFLEAWAARFASLRLLQQGRLTLYLVYVFVTVLALLGWSALRAFWTAA